jgi:hypothetical protein
VRTAVHNPTITTRYADRWPQGLVGLRHTRIVKNARLYLATPDGQVAKIGWGDLGLEQWHTLHAIAGDGLVLVARENRHGNPVGHYDRSDAPDATLEDLIPGLVLALDRTTAVLLNHDDPERHTLGAVSLPAVDREQTRAWLVDRLAELTAHA